MDPYEILQLSPAASPLDIRKAYLALAKALHPDVCQAPDALQRFQEVQFAYNLLKDPIAREIYRARQAAEASKAALDNFRKQQATRRDLRKQRRNRSLGLGRWWR
jgi:curved DNA-binding protein CbpA